MSAEQDTAMFDQPDEDFEELFYTYNDGYECETCGWNDDSLHIVYYEGKFDFVMRSGCYSGASFFSENRTQFAKQMQEERDYVARVFPRAIRAYDEMIEKIASQKR